MLCVMQLERVNWENRTLKQQLQYADPVLLLLSGPTLLCISLVSCPKKHAETINRQTVCFLLVADPDEGPSRTATKRASIGHVRSTVASLLVPRSTVLYIRESVRRQSHPPPKTQHERSRRKSAPNSSGTGKRRVPISGCFYLRIYAMGSWKKPSSQYLETTKSTNRAGEENGRRKSDIVVV